MNVLLIITNINGYHEVPYSFGLSSIANYIESKGYNAKIIALRNENNDQLIKEIDAFNPRVIGFTCVSSQFNHVNRISEIIKSINNNILIVCGGTHPTLFPEAILNSKYIDGFFVGESEIAFGDFLDSVNKNEEFRNTNNFTYLENGDVISNKLNPLIQDLDILPFQRKDGLFAEFIKVNRMAPFFFSRGCPYACSYCSNHALAKRYGLERNTPRYRSVDSCIKEIHDAMKKHDFNKVWIMDDTFGIDTQWRKEFCIKYKNEINLKFMCLLRVNILDREFIELLKKAGCYRIMFGVESGNEFVRNIIMKKNISNKQIYQAFSLCDEYDIETCAINIIGVPGETEDMIWDTIKLNREIKPTDSGINIFYPYKGTELGDYCFSEKLVDEKKYDDFSNERRESVLKYPIEYKKRLQNFLENWDILVFPYNVKKQIYARIRKKKNIYNLLRKIKHTLSSKLNER